LCSRATFGPVPRSRYNRGMGDEKKKRRYRVLKSLAIASVALAWVVVNAIFFVPVLIWGNTSSSGMLVPAQIALALISAVGLLMVYSKLNKAAERQREPRDF
jgi:putative Mn2+ efflux pump MntP